MRVNFRISKFLKTSFSKWPITDARKTTFLSDKVTKHCRLLLKTFRFKSLHYTQFVYLWVAYILFPSELAWGVNGDA